MRLRRLGVLALVGLAPLAPFAASCGASARRTAMPRSSPSQAALPSPDAARPASNELTGDAASDVTEPMTTETPDASAEAGAGGPPPGAVPSGACNEQPPQD